MSPRSPALLTVLGLLGCSPSAHAQPPNVGSGPAPEVQQPPSSPPSAPEAPPPTTPEAANQPNPEPGPPPADVQPLPELTVRLVGLHVGGGPNDPEGKKPFISTLEKGFPAYLVCYRQAEEPDKPGTFGVDLRIDASGGHPSVKEVRTAMKGEGLRQCLEQAFVSLDFQRPFKGATIISASIRFALVE